MRCLVRDRRGSPLASLAEAGDAKLAGAHFVAVLCHDDGVLPAVAAVEPAQAVAHLTLADRGRSWRGRPPRTISWSGCRPAASTAYLLKFGRVGGADPEHSIEITRDHVAAILDAIAAGTVEWERDPDFGYRVAAAVPASRAATVSFSSLASCMPAPSVYTSTRPWFPS